MFKFLREKLGGWIKKKEEVEETLPEVKEEKKDKKTRSKEITREDEKEKKAEIKIEKKEVLKDADKIIEEKEKEDKKGFFFKLKESLSLGVLTQEQFDKVFEELEMVLLESNVALEAVDKIRSSLSKSLVNVSIKKRDIENTILESLQNAVLEILVEEDDLVERFKNEAGTKVILFFGINGSGKTTTIAKMAWKFKEKGVSSVLVAADTFRAASIEQLEEHAHKIGVPIVKGAYGADPSSVAFDGVNYANKHKIKIVLIDTAGRMYTQGNLMREMEKIVRVAKPDLKIFVGESITGNDAISQAQSFNEAIGIDGVILSKADVDEKAGTILSVSYITGKPIYYLGVGQKYADLKVFRKKDVLKGLGLQS